MASIVLGIVNKSFKKKKPKAQFDKCSQGKEMGTARETDGGRGVESGRCF